MKYAPIPANEAARLRALLDYDVLDTPAEAAFDALTTLAAHIAGVPIALVSLVDADRQWFKSRYGLEAPQTPRDISFCGHVVAADAPLVVADALLDDRFADNPLVAGGPRVRFYAGMPLRSPAGFTLGTLCAIDDRPRELSDEQFRLLALLAEQVVSQLELRRQNRALRARQLEVEDLQRLFSESLDLMCVSSRTGALEQVNPAFTHTLGWSKAELLGRSFLEFVHPDDRRETLAQVDELTSGETALRMQNRYMHADGSWRRLSWRAVAAPETGRVYAVGHDITAVAAAAERAAHQAALQAAILDSADLAFIATDLEGVVVTFTVGAERLLGYPSDEVVGRITPGALHDPAEVVARAEALSAELGRVVEPGFDAFVIKARVTGQPDENEWTYVRKDGSRVRVLLSVTAIRGEDGELSGYLGVARDLSERDAAEGFARQLLMSAPTALVVAEMDGSIVQANPRAAELFGYGPDELVGRSVHELVPEALATRHQGHMAGFVGDAQQRLMGEGREVVGKRRDGTRLHLEVGLAPVQTASGPAVLASVTDVTQRRFEARSTETLLAVQRHLARATDTDEAVRVTLREVLTRLDWSVATLWQATPDGESLEVAEFVSTRPVAAFEQATRSSRVGRGETLPGMAWATGEGAWHPDVSSVASCLRAAAATECGVRAMASFPVDVGDAFFGVIEFGADRALEMNPALFRTLDSVCAELAHFLYRQRADAALVQATRAAEQASAAKSLFLATMSHEIRTPMNAVLGLAHLTLRTELTARQRDYVTKLSGSARALLGVINDILDFSKIEADKLTIEHVPFNLDEVLTNLSSSLGMLAENKGIEVILDVPSELPRRLIGDALRLQQVLLNLCSNAIKFTEAGEVVVTMREERLDDGTMRLHCQVRDSGIGIPEDALKRLFHAFTQADASTTRRYGGTGLGLSICRRLVELMDGSISARSEVGVGSTFEFNVLVAVDTSERHAATEAPLRPGMRVLVVDDHDIALQVAAQLLGAWNMEVATASSGPPALALYDDARTAGRPFDLVLLDWRMPGMDGIEVAQRLLATDGAGSGTPIVIASAAMDDKLLDAADRVGIERVIAKPYTASTLQVAMAEALTRDATPGRRRVRDEGADDIPDLRGARVLLVEDNDINQQVATELLTQAGVTVVCAEDGAQALRLANPSFDAVLMDLQMPVMDGFEATRRWLERADVGHIPVIAMTANAMVEDREAVAAAGMVDFVGKPVDPAALYRVLARWVAPRETPASTETTTAATTATTTRLRTAAPSLPADGLPGVDIPTALARLGGNARLLSELLLRLHSSQSDASDRIDTALGEGDLETATREAHNLRGLCGNLGATEAAADAAELEAALRAGESPDAPLARLRGSLANVLAGIGAWERDAPAALAPAPRRRKDDPALRGDLHRLRGLLADDDASAVPLSAELAGRVPPNLRQALAEVGEFASHYAFGEALSRLDGAIRGEWN
jgi:two-component system sensor histidine kinase/response regulator